MWCPKQYPQGTCETVVWWHTVVEVRKQRAGSFGRVDSRINGVSVPVCSLRGDGDRTSEGCWWDGLHCFRLCTFWMDCKQLSLLLKTWLKKKTASPHLTLRDWGGLCPLRPSLWPFPQEIWRDWNELSQQKEVDSTIFQESSWHVSCTSTYDYKIDQSDSSAVKAIKKDRY